MTLLVVLGLVAGTCVGPGYVPPLQEWDGPSYRMIMGRPDALQALEELFEEMEELGFILYPVVISGYRSYERQAQLHELDPDWTEPAGCSQHQLGTAFDLAYQGLSIHHDDMRNTRLWHVIGVLGEKYGFTQTYADDEGLILPEPWHFNYEPAPVRIPRWAAIYL